MERCKLSCGPSLMCRIGPRIASHSDVANPPLLLFFSPRNGCFSAVASPRNGCFFSPHLRPLPLLFHFHRRELCRPICFANLRRNRYGQAACFFALFSKNDHDRCQESREQARPLIADRRSLTEPSSGHPSVALQASIPPRLRGVALHGWNAPGACRLRFFQGYDHFGCLTPGSGSWNRS